MAYLKLGDTQYPLTAGETTIGAYDGAGIRLPSGDSTSRAVVSVEDSGVSIRLGAAESVVMVNGVQVAIRPTPLVHGDKVQIAGHELRLGEEVNSGSTSFVSAADVARMVASRSATAPKKATGGRLVSVADGREYIVLDAGVSFGREVGNDIVIANTEISRKHASIAPASAGYVLTDHSANGVWVNGTRVTGNLLLRPADVIKMGADEFHFFADVAMTPAVAVFPVAAAPAAPLVARTALATLEVTAEGLLKGLKFELHSTLTNVGRGEHNDIAIRDESISDSHAKIQKRGDGWYVVDQESTNGTYVGGRRIKGEVRVEGAPDLRFGGIKMIFRPAFAPVVEGVGTRAFVRVNVDPLRKQAAVKSGAPAVKAPAPAQTNAAERAAAAKNNGRAAVLLVIVTLVGASLWLLNSLLFSGR